MSEYNTKPLPCPCGSTNLGTSMDNDCYMHVRCKDCGMEGLSDDELAAIAWNYDLDRSKKNEPVTQGA